MAGKVPLTFRIFKGDTLLREEKLVQPVIKVGKLSSSHLRLDDEGVSRMHAVIEVTGPNDVSIIDLGSTKGTFVNGQKVNKAKLQSGDTIVVGDTRIEVTIGGDADELEDLPTQVQQSPASEPPRAAPVAPPPMAAPPRPVAPPSAPTMVSASAPAPSTFGAPQSYAPPPGARPAPVAANPMMMGGGSAPSFGNDALEDLGGARAIEVAAMLGNSVVGVKHVMNPKGGKVTGGTYALFATGAALLIMGVIAFGIAVGIASENKEARAVWVDELKKPPYEFRPKPVPVQYDFLAFGGIGFGVIAFTYAMLRLRNEKESPWFRIGSAPDVEFPLNDAPQASFPLVAPLGDDFVFNYTQQMQGELMLDGKATSLADLQSSGQARPSSTAPGALELAIPHKARIRVRAGGATFLVSSVPAPRKQAVPLFADWESRVLAFFAASAVVHLGFILLLRTIPPDPRSLALDLGSNENRLTRVQSKADEDPKQEEEELPQDNSDEESGGTGTAMALDEGKMGKEDSDRAEGQYKMKNENIDPQLAKQQQVDAAREAGFLGALKAQQGGAFASLTGTGDISSGIDDVNIYGGLLGDEAGEMQGGFGFGRSGFGPGGGGTGWGTIGTGRYGTIGHGSGTGSGYGAGGGRGGLRGRQAAVPNVKIGNVSATGDLDKNIIRRYIRRKLPQIKYCYEKQLLVKPGLGGTVNTDFQISPTGAVLNSKATGVDGDVSSCVADVIKTIQFPKPKGGGLVNVRYPFTFRPTGG
jgi:pSer/pThr/pTyr-binding forkhead associated (FHA) protein